MNKRYLSFIVGFILLIQVAAVAQELSEASVLQHDPAMQKSDFVPGVVLIKFRDSVQAGMAKGGGVEFNVASLNRILQNYSLRAVRQLFPEASTELAGRSITTYSGYTYQVPNLRSIYKIELEDPDRMFALIHDLQRDPNVVYAEPDYILSIDGKGPAAGPVSRGGQGSTDQTANTVPNDPFFGQQWYLDAAGVVAAWDSTTGDTTSLIAILDTGVDWSHPDLVDKIWVNEAELNGLDGVDDDGNGFVDDIRGWDFINHDNDPMDDNSHGTHVAGIAAAASNNAVGIAGVNWQARILPIKVFQSSGRGDVSTITEGIRYAIDAGATVLNMSFGTYARPLTMEEVLKVAYAKAVLVAAAGNDGKCIGPGAGCAPHYPAALPFVLGVQATSQNGSRASFSNYDQDGPIFSKYDDLLNYEISAPGVAIFSTIPHGNYRNFNGTSMATPLVAGAAAMYRTHFPNHTQELMWGNFIHSGNGRFSLIDIFQADSKPALNIVSYTLKDSLDGDNDGRVDAGETVELVFTLRNTWGQADSVWLGIRFGEFEDTTVADIQADQAFIGSISAYATRTNEANPLRIKVHADVVHNREIVFEAYTWATGLTDTVRQKVVLRVENGDELVGVLDSTKVLKANRFWIVSRSFRIGRNGRLIIQPGTRIKIEDNNYIALRGRIEAIGKPDSMIVFHGPGAGILIDDMNAYGVFKYCRFEYLYTPLGVVNSSISGADTTGFYVENCVFTDILGMFFHDFVMGGQDSFGQIRVFRNNVVQNSLLGKVIDLSGGTVKVFEKNNYYNIRTSINAPSYNYLYPPIFRWNNFVQCIDVGSVRGNNLSPDQAYNNFISFRKGKYAVLMDWSVMDDVVQMSNQYWGTTDTTQIDSMIFDFWDNASLPMLDYHPFLTAPADSAHGVVWKVELNKDEPIGVGPVRFFVYFNRPMDTTYTPVVSFGVRNPFTQNLVADSSYWSSDRRMWSGVFNVTLSTGDGINTIRVAGARDPEGFEIPVEDTRFRFVLDASGAASTGFSATAGVGKVELEWNDPGIDDLLGYNLYRFARINDSTFSDTTRINESLLSDTTFTDFDVEAGNTYYYVYTIVRTDFSESDFSHVTSATVLAATKGDANGDQAVNILDVVTTVSYILARNPEPFVFDAADVNGDGRINVLDVVGIIQLSLNGAGTAAVAMDAAAEGLPARLYFEKRRLILESPVEVRGLQFTLQRIGGEARWKTLDALKSFEVVHSPLTGDSVTVVAYSLRGKTLPAGKHDLLAFTSDSLKLRSAVLADADGRAIPVDAAFAAPVIPEDYVLLQNYPNPFNPETAIEFGLPKGADRVEIHIYNVLGQRVRVLQLTNPEAGFHRLVWDGRDARGRRMASGLYFYQMRVRNQGQMQILGSRKMMLLR